MAKKRAFGLILGAFLLLTALAIAQEEKAVSFSFTFHSDDSVEIDDVWVREGVPDLRNIVNSSDYKIVVSFKDQTSIEQFYEVVFLVAAQTEEGSSAFETQSTFLNAEFAYKENPGKVQIYHGSKLIFEKNLEFLCNNDNSCNNEETSISCSSDCSKSVEDGWCDSIADGVCDPDCQVYADIDCSCGNNVCDSNENAENCADDCYAEEEISTDAPKFLFLSVLIVVLIILGIGGYFLYKKYRKQG